MEENRAITPTQIAIEKVGETVSGTVGEVVGEKVGEKVGELSENLVSYGLTHVKEKLGAVGIKPTTLTIVIKYTMEVVEKTPLKGPAQMDFSLRIISDLITELPDTDEKVYLRQIMDNGGIKDTIELVVEATKGEIDVNKVADVAAKNCLGACYNYIISKCS